jgi:hypothetical protein
VAFMAVGGEGVPSSKSNRYVLQPRWVDIGRYEALGAKFGGCSSLWELRFDVQSSNNCKLGELKRN